MDGERRTMFEATSTGTARSESRPLGRWCASTCARHKQARCQNTARTTLPFPTHRSVSAVSWPTASGIVPVSPFPHKYLRSTTNEPVVRPPPIKKTAHSDSQVRQRRKLAHSARNRAHQTVLDQGPALGEQTSPLLDHRTNSKSRRRPI